MQEIRIISVPEGKFDQLLNGLEDVKNAQKKLISDTQTDFLYTEDEACKIFKCSKKTMQNWRSRGYISYVQLGSVIRIQKSAILEFADRFKVNASV